MGFFGFFKNLSGGGKPKISPEDLIIDITDSMITINGKSVDIPCHLSVLENMLGRPRKTVAKKSGNVNFTWDAPGICCYTKGNGVVYCIGVKVNVGGTNSDTEPRSTFKGRLTIFGEQWEEFMYAGEDMDGIFRQRVTDGLSIVSEYKDFEALDKNGPHGAYSGIEIELRGFSQFAAKE